ncbi:MAG: tripartite tricarboxylate transporter substrate-binding protein, partial [Burkholderiales bacterium]
MIAKALLAALLAALPFLTRAQDSYPSKAVTIVVPYPPAGQADLSARPLASALQQILKQPFVVMNRPGAAGAVGNRAVATAAADGYTILVTLVSITTIPEVERMFGRAQSYS